MSIINIFITFLILGAFGDACQDIYDYKKSLPSRRKRKNKHKYLKS